MLMLPLASSYTNSLRLLSVCNNLPSSSATATWIRLWYVQVIDQPLEEEGVRTYRFYYEQEPAFEPEVVRASLRREAVDPERSRQWHHYSRLQHQEGEPRARLGMSPRLIRPGCHPLQLCADPSSRPGFLSDKQLESALKVINKRFPNFDIKVRNM